ncbi:metal-dependent transcriptional regulator [Arenibacter aquaticus]|uniref:Transcriptional regulator MntR n=1 Tax=Arenibacter aquaticus TaxID=2489054 RepID=A0A3S0CIZ4_9FLAO|nr:metal-dependent transcriptional regulator [Arenibacter aquaticus]RTE52432.1 metal-dependent transcriptional regulator [Arenibacter aquaticus]
MNSLVEENYLKALFSLSNEHGEVNVNDLSKRLEIKMPTVTSMMKKLAEKELVHYEKYRPVRLSEMGKKAATHIIRKHRLTEMFLVEVMGFGWEEVHDIAEQIEHVKSPVFFNKMDEILGHPSFDPHGSPIPDINGNIHGEQYRKFSECKKGERVKFMAVANSSENFLKFLNTKGLSLETQIEILSVEPFDGTMTVTYGDRPSEVFSKVVCDKLLVV